MQGWHFKVVGDKDAGTEYGSCGLTKADAMEQLQIRLKEDKSKGRIVSCTPIGSVCWSFPTVICYR